MPKISVLMPAYNAEKYIEEAITSVLNQTFTDFELLVINDGSTDGTEKIILSFNDERIRYIKNERNLKLVATLNKGIDLARGKYIARMDADDVCLPDRLKKQWEYLEKHPETGLCGTWAFVINESGKMTNKIINQTEPEFVSINLLFSVPLIHPSVCCRTAILKEYKYADMPLFEDYEIWCRMNETVKMANIPEFLLKYRWHTNNVSKSEEATLRLDRAVVKQQIARLGLFPDDETFRIHQLSFRFHTLDNAPDAVSTADLDASETWFAELISANKQKNRYNQKAFTAFLWGRWIVLCMQLKVKRKIFSPSFASWHPKTLYFLWKQIRLLTKKFYL